MQISFDPENGKYYFMELWSFFLFWFWGPLKLLRPLKKAQILDSWYQRMHKEIKHWVGLVWKLSVLGGFQLLDLIIPELKSHVISLIIKRCPDTLTMRFTAKPYILWKSLFHWIWSKFYEFKHGHNFFWPQRSWRLLEAKNTPRRPKMA